VRTLTGRHSGSVFSVAFSPNGTRIVSGSGDKLVKIWDAATGAEVTSMWECFESGEVMRVVCRGFRACFALKLDLKEGVFAGVHAGRALEPGVLGRVLSGRHAHREWVG